MAVGTQSATYVAGYSSAGAAVMRQDPLNGTVVWTTALGGSANEYQPVGLALGSNSTRLYASTPLPGGLFAVAADTGRVAWSALPRKSLTQSAQGMVMLESADASTSLVGVWTYRPGSAFTMVRDDGSHATTLWEWTDPNDCGEACGYQAFVAASSDLLDASTVVVLTVDDSRQDVGTAIAAVSAATGKVLWNASLEGAQAVSCAPMVLGDRVVMIRRIGEIESPQGPGPAPTVQHGYLSVMSLATGASIAEIVLPGQPGQLAASHVPGQVFVTTFPWSVEPGLPRLVAAGVGDSPGIQWQLVLGPNPVLAGPMIVSPTAVTLRALFQAESWPGTERLVVVDTPSDGRPASVRGNWSFCDAFRTTAGYNPRQYVHEPVPTASGLWASYGDLLGVFQ